MSAEDGSIETTHGSQEVKLAASTKEEPILGDLGSTGKSNSLAADAISSSDDARIAEGREKEKHSQAENIELSSSQRIVEATNNIPKDEEGTENNIDNGVNEGDRSETKDRFAAHSDNGDLLEPKASEVASETVKPSSEQSETLSSPQVDVLARTAQQALIDEVDAGGKALDHDETALKSTEAQERDLPAPPTPSKRSSRDDKAEMIEVAKAFGVHLKLTDDGNEGASKTKQAATTVAAAAPNDTSLGTPFSPSNTDGVTPKRGIRIGKGPPPQTQASEEKPFDFNRFLDQMRHKSAGPVGEYVRSFIKGFTKKPYRVTDQTKLIFDFLDFISLRMRECEVWARLTTAEFDNAIEAMEKLLMNRLYNYTFSPAVKKEGKWNVQTDDLERDRVLKQRVRLFSWITEEHLDVPVGTHSKGFVDFAIEELLKINHYKAPRDKVICILNCCKVIFGLIRHLSSEENADTFIPILIFVVLQANPDNLISNVEYISRFRNPERLSSESGYYLSSLMGAIAFIETMDYTSLSNITQQEFEAKVEEAVERISIQPDSMDSSPATADHPAAFTTEKLDRSTTSSPLKSAVDEAGRNIPIAAGAAAIAEDTKAFFQRTGEAARAGIGASLGKPMGALGRLFQEGLDGPRTPGGGAGPSSAMSSGRVTPDGPQVITTPGVTESNTARSRMWNLFGVDEEEAKRRQQMQTQQRGGRGHRDVSTSSSSLNFGSWSRNMRDDEDPQTPVSEELVQGRFASLDSGDGDLQGAPRAQRQHQLQQQQHRRMPERMGSMDPYSIQDDGVMASGVRTPEDEGDESDVEYNSPTTTTGAGRPRLSNLGGFLPSFLSDPQLGRPPSSQRQGSQQQSQRQDQRRNLQRDASDGNDSFNDEEAARATAEIEQAHISAGVETLQSIFPGVETSVCKLVLEGCHGDVQASIDKLLEMQ